MTRKFEVPKEIWCDFINVLYAATRHIEPTEENSNCMNFIKNEIQRSIESEEVLVVDGKIVDRDEFLKDKTNVN